MARNLILSRRMPVKSVQQGAPQATVSGERFSAARRLLRGGRTLNQKHGGHWKRSPRNSTYHRGLPEILGYGIQDEDRLSRRGAQRTHWQSLHGTEVSQEGASHQPLALACVAGGNRKSQMVRSTDRANPPRHFYRANHRVTAIPRSFRAHGTGGGWVTSGSNRVTRGREKLRIADRESHLVAGAETASADSRERMNVSRAGPLPLPLPRIPSDVSRRDACEARLGKRDACEARLGKITRPAQREP